MKTRVGYRRVSSLDQNPDRQLEGLTFDKIFTDYASGKDTKRPQYEAMMLFLREGDSLYVHSLDRLGRNLVGLKKIVDELVERRVTVHFLKENMIFDGNQSSTSVLLFNILASFAEFERINIKERQKEGIDLAKAKGLYRKGPQVSEENILEIQRLLNEGVSQAKVARKMDISSKTIARYIQQKLLLPSPKI